MSFSQMLDYESELLLELMEYDGLLIMAKGLGLDRIILKAMFPFCNQENLVFLLNASNEEQTFFIDELSLAGVQHLPNIITAEIGPAERERCYLEGGVFFATSRIIVVDMLAKRIPIDFVTGIMVHRAHKIGESSQEAFILRMFREGNSNGFIKGFSDSPSAFMVGYSQVERIMKQLFVHKLYLRPRFHVDVNSCLEKHKPNVVELSVELTPLMSGIQLSLLDLISSCLRELKKVTPSLDPESVTLENSLDPFFDKMLQSQLNPMWNQLNNKAKQLVSDLKILRTLMAYLTQYDCVTFYNFLRSLRSNDSSNSKDSIWMYLDGANSVFANAKARIYGVEKSTKDGKTYTDGTLESCPKWDALVEILNEVEEENKKDTGKILICTSDERTCFQVRQLLREGSESMLNFLMEKSSLENKFSSTSNQVADKRKVGKKSKDRMFPVDDIDERFTINVCPNSVLVIHPLYGNADPYSLLRKLYELQPKYVILYDARMEFVRQLEVYKACHHELPLSVYFLFYNGSVEEQRYLMTLRKENEAFEVLIRQKADMVIPEERQGKTDVARSLIRNQGLESKDVSTRKAGGREPGGKKKLVIVDMREFRSELPSLIHKRGMEIEPVTLEVGDYILSPELCIERKSISDLIGSLNNGRLYSQCVAMTRYYKRPILLIEFDETKSFSLQAKQSIREEVSLQNISSKLTLLTIHFPNLRIIWSQSPHLTAEIFEDLKSNAKEPSSEVAITVGVDQDELMKFSQFNALPSDIVQKFPGITGKNYRRVMLKYSCLKDLVNQSEEDIGKAIENKDFAKRFFNFVTQQHDVTQISLKKKK